MLTEPWESSSFSLSWCHESLMSTFRFRFIVSPSHHELRLSFLCCVACLLWTFPQVELGAESETFSCRSKCLLFNGLCMELNGLYIQMISFHKNSQKEISGFNDHTKSSFGSWGACFFVAYLEPVLLGWQYQVKTKEVIIASCEVTAVRWQMLLPIRIMSSSSRPYAHALHFKRKTVWGTVCWISFKNKF